MNQGNARFGTYLKSLRESRWLTLEDVERQTLHAPEPVTRSMLSRLENGKANISALKLISLSKVYGLRFGLLAERLEMDVEFDCTDVGDVPDLSPEALADLAAKERRAGRFQRALMLYRHCEDRIDQARSPNRCRIRARFGTVKVLCTSGRYRSAKMLAEDLLAEPLAPADRARVLLLFAQSSLAVGQLLLTRAAVTTLDEVPRPWPSDVELSAVVVRAQIYAMDGHFAEAKKAWLEILDAVREVRDDSTEGIALLGLAAAERELGSPPNAMRWIQQASALAREHQMESLQVRALIEEGRIHASAKQPRFARRVWIHARRLARAKKMHAELFELYLGLWRLAMHEKDEVEARACLRSLRQIVRMLEVLPPHARDLEPHLEGPCRWATV